MSTAPQEHRRASVRDLRNRFATVAKWIEDGEEVTITRGGEAFATLAPARRESAGEADWAKRFKVRPPIPADRKLTQEETQAFYEQMKGDL